MSKSLIKLTLFFLLIWGALFAVEKFDVHIKIPEQIFSDDTTEQESQGFGGAIRNEGAVNNEDNFQGTVDDIIEYVNQSREQEGLPGLAKNEKLMESALLKAEDMRDKGYFDHVNPDGLDMTYFISAVGYGYSTVGENLAEGYFSAQSVHEAWMNSEGHRHNILGEDYEEIGVAVVEIEKDGYKSYVAVQHFGSELKKQEVAAPQITGRVCDKKVKKYCKNAKENKKKVKDAIEQQEEYIDDAKANGYSEKDLRELYERLEELKDMKSEIKDYLKDCDKYISRCDEWE